MDNLPGIDHNYYSGIPWWSDPKFIGKIIPVTAGIMNVYAFILQIIRMIQDKSSLGQNPWSWGTILIILSLWAWFYKVCTPDNKFAYNMTRITLGFGIAVLLTNLYYEVK